MKEDCFKGLRTYVLLVKISNDRFEFKVSCCLCFILLLLC